MQRRAAVSKRTDPPQFDPNRYAGIALNDLVVYAVYFLHRQGLEISSEDIISACFVLFPQRFSLRKYPHWPDSSAVSRRWSDCKSRGYLRGNAVSGFQITAKGIRRAEQVGKRLGKPVKPVRAARPTAKKPAIPAAEAVHPELKAQAKKYIRSIEASEAYRHYTRKQPLNEFDFRSLLLCTMESPPATLARNLAQFKEYVTLLDRRDLFAFLEFCEKKFSSMLPAAAKPVDDKIQKAKK